MTTESHNTSRPLGTPSSSLASYAEGERTSGVEAFSAKHFQVKRRPCLGARCAEPRTLRVVSFARSARQARAWRSQRVALSEVSLPISIFHAGRRFLVLLRLVWLIKFMLDGGFLVVRRWAGLLIHTRGGGLVVCRRLAWLLFSSFSTRDGGLLLVSRRSRGSSKSHGTAVQCCTASQGAQCRAGGRFLVVPTSRTARECAGRVVRCCPPSRVPSHRRAGWCLWLFTTLRVLGFFARDSRKSRESIHSRFINSTLSIPSTPSTPSTSSNERPAIMQFSQIFPLRSNLLTNKSTNNNT